jgi:hypothetical protein
MPRVHHVKEENKGMKLLKKAAVSPLMACLAIALALGSCSRANTAKSEAEIQTRIAHGRRGSRAGYGLRAGG